MDCGPIRRCLLNSPIDPGMPLSNIGVYESVGNSSYNGLWATANKQFSRGLTFNVSYAWSKSIDENSRNNQGLVLQDSNNVHGDRGLSDFDVRHRVVISGIYSLPFRGNRLKEGWQFSLIEQIQTGNPLNFHTTNSAFTGSALLRPNVTGAVITGFAPATNGSASSVTYIQDPGVLVNQGNAFGRSGTERDYWTRVFESGFCVGEEYTDKGRFELAGAGGCVRFVEPDEFHESGFDCWFVDDRVDYRRHALSGG